MTAEVQYTFLVDNLDVQSNLTKQFKLLHWPADSSIELYDIKLRRLMLKRTVYPSVTIQQLYLGNNVSIYARQYKIIQYADTYTEQRLCQVKSSNFILVKSTAIQYIGTILDILLSTQPNAQPNPFVLTRLAMLAQCSEQLVGQVVTMDNTVDSIDKKQLINDLSTAPVIAIELIGSTGALKAVLSQCDATDTELLRNVYYVDQSANEVAKQLLTSQPLQSLYLQQSDMPYTIVIIKPHAVTANLTGKIIDDIQAQGYLVSGLKSVQLDTVSAEELCEVYKGVLPEYHALIQQYTQGISVAVEVTRADCATTAELVNEFRKFAGPVDPEIGKHIRVDSLRARYGDNKVYNALHTTDLPDDAVLEAEFLFSILQ